MLPISVLFIVIFVVVLFLLTATYLHYLLHKYYNKDLICYIENNIYLLRYDVIDILIAQHKELSIDFDYLDTYFKYLEKYLYQKYIKTLKE